MDRVVLQQKAGAFFAKYKFVALILLLGIVLMSLPASAEPAETVQPTEAVLEQPDISDELSAILSQIEGVGKVRVMLTQATGPETVYQTDEDSSSDSVRVETVIITDENRAQNGLVKTVTPATYLGAIIVCQGADRPSVKLSVVQAVANVTGISADRITVLKMK